MSKSRIWEVVQEPDNDEGNSYTRAVFDNEPAASSFIDAVHRLEYQAYLDERTGWAGGKPAPAPPPAVEYDMWLASDFHPILTHGYIVIHIYDQMHTPTVMHVEPGWLYGSVPRLVLHVGVRTEDEIEEMNAALAAIPTFTSRRALRRARREARERAASGSTETQEPRGG